jgi:hypothetical protein
MPPTNQNAAHQNIWSAVQFVITTLGFLQHTSWHKRTKHTILLMAPLAQVSTQQPVHQWALLYVVVNVDQIMAPPPSWALVLGNKKQRNDVYLLDRTKYSTMHVFEHIL